ncbi:MAG TPA: phosphoribosylaminoimidazolesuccinocarboxamide synthase [Candidatus Goldiibacteriota bacterium]|nr:phosphoribosylaminoimidazolesuccinocarboxamide synthase [Candidatus Goldiibacteriota bacterium]
MGSVKEVEILRPAADDREGEGEFIFSDRYSVFDWGEMPDHIDKKGAALCTLSSYFFHLLEKNGIKTHFLGLMENGVPKKFHDLKSYSNKMRVKVLRVIKPPYDKSSNKYDYSEYKKKQKNYLIPLEVIYRNSLPEGSSVFKRISSGSATYQSLGLDHMPVPGEKLKIPVLDVSTKLEHTDRYIDWKEAQEISGLSDSDISKVKDLILRINSIITGVCESAGITNVDGKFEFGIDTSGEIIVIDVLGTPDECRFMYGDFHISKEFARRWYRKTAWYEEIEKAKKENGSDWKKSVKNQPPNLPPEMKKLLSDMYLAVTNGITGRKFFDVPELKEVIAGLKKYDA